MNRPAETEKQRLGRSDLFRPHIPPSWKRHRRPDRHWRRTAHCGNRAEPEQAPGIGDAVVPTGAAAIADGNQAVLHGGVKEGEAIGRGGKMIEMDEVGGVGGDIRGQRDGKGADDAGSADANAGGVQPDSGIIIGALRGAVEHCAKIGVGGKVNRIGNGGRAVQGIDFDMEHHDGNGKTIGRGISRQNPDGHLHRKVAATYAPGPRQQ